MWRRTFDHLKSWAASSTRLVNLGATIVVGAVLFTPSIWMLSTIPPLWRDVDAYIQLTYPPDIITIVHFGPVYCFAARIPLYIGYAVESLRTGSPFPHLDFFIHPKLTDPGVFLLLLSQHVALFCSAFYLIVLTSPLFWVRLALAALWAANPLFYAFAHCVGSETLSMILLIVAGAAGLRIVQRRGSVGWKEWGLFGVLLWLSILTRHINAVLAAVLPLTFLLLSGYRLITIPLSRSQLLGRWRRLRMRHELKKAAVAVMIGIISLALANVSLRGLCRVAHVPYNTTIGINLISRLDFLARLPSEKRNQFLDEIGRNTPFVEVKKAILLLNETFSKEADNWDIKTLSAYFANKDGEKAIPLYREAFQQGPEVLIVTLVFQMRAVSAFAGPSLYVALKRAAEAFFFPPRKVYLGAVAEDFRRSQATTIPNVVNYLFLSTTFYFFFAAGTMPDCARLVTFRNRSPNQVVAILEKHWYFHLWKSLTYAGFLCFWAVNLVLLAVLPQMPGQRAAAVASYAVALTLVGLVMMIANCFLVAFLPRCTLPMWELTIVSLTALLGLTLDDLAGKLRKSNRACRFTS